MVFEIYCDDKSIKTTGKIIRIPKGVKEIYTECVIDKPVIFNDDLESLVIGDGALAIPTQIPNSVKFIELRGEIDYPLNFPENLETLLINTDYKFDFKIPPNLKTLHINSSVIKIPSKLPETITVLMIDTTFDNSFEFPPNLTNLTLTSSDEKIHNQVTTFPKLPSSLKTLTIEDQFYYDLVCPENLDTLYLNVENKLNIIFNDKLRILVNQSPFDRFDLPESLREFYNYTDSCGDFNIPKNIQSIRISKEFKKKVETVNSSKVDLF
jgi:hypothetical protein